MNAANNFINYGYLADGQKRQKAYFDPVNAPSTATTHYRGTMVFNDDGTPDYVLHPEGMAVHTGNNEWQWHFNLTDYLGNTRAVLDENGNVLQQTDYYPFGTAFVLDNTAKNKYLYGGKELQSEGLGGTQLGLYDFEARFYDPNRGIFPSPDPLVERPHQISMSPYAYCGNNPANRIDPDGRDWFVDGETGNLYFFRNISNLRDLTKDQLQEFNIDLSDPKRFENLGKDDLFDIGDMTAYWARGEDAEIFTGNNGYDKADRIYETREETRQRYMEVDGSMFRSEATTNTTISRYKSYAQPDDLYKRKDYPSNFKSGWISDTEIKNYEYKVPTGSAAVLPKSKTEIRRERNAEGIKNLGEFLKIILPLFTK